MAHSYLSTVIRSFRPHQWAKNLLLFVPVLTSHRFTEEAVLAASLGGFAVLCILASSVYVLNDAFDVEADRNHPSKRTRPIAAGKIPLGVAWGLGAILSVAALTAAFTLNASSGVVCVAYFLISVAYSGWIKTFAILDVFTLATLYTLRIVAGGVLTGIPISVWLGAFSIFIFLSLALCKRYAELNAQIAAAAGQPSANQKLQRRGYYSSDAPFVLTQGLVFMGCATLVLAVYLSSDAVVLLYRSPSILWLAVMIVSFWGARLWLLSFRRQMHEDPVLFALKDVTSWLCLVLLSLVFFAAMLIGTR